MNHVYRIIWNETLGTWVAVAENVKRKGKRSTSKTMLQVALLISTSVIVAEASAYNAVTTCKPTSSCSNSNDFEQTIKLNSSTASSSGIGAIAKGENGKNGRDGALFVKPKAGGDGKDTGGVSYKPTSEKFDELTGTITIIYDAYTFDKDNKEVRIGQREVVYKPISLKSILDSSVTSVQYTREIRDSWGGAATTDTITANKVTVATGEFVVSIASGFPLDVNYSATEPTAAEPAVVNPRLGVEVSSTTGAHREVTATGTKGLYAISEGGKGGKGGDYILGGSGKPGGTGGDASDAYLLVKNIDLTMGTNDAVGVYVKSKGGKGGDGGGAYGAIVGGGGGGNAGGEGKGAIIDIENSSIVMKGNNSIGVLGVSEGGEGGNAGGAVGLVTHQGKNQTAGKAGDVKITIDSNTTIIMNGNESVGIMGQSVGGAGGNTGFAVSIANLGGKGGSGGDAGTVNIDNSAFVETKGARDSSAIIAQSLGGGGGSGRFSAAGYSLGAQGGAGGDSGTVTVKNNNILKTVGTDSHGILAQAIGGGGGNSSKSLGFAGIGGNATSGGAGGDVTVKTETKSIISVKGDHSSGIVAQSIGGGGGNAGLTVGIVSIGGNGGTGNDAKSVTVDNKGTITTEGSKDAAGILAQSIGGGGGNGSMSVAVGGLVSVAIGGKGADGGEGGSVAVTSSGNDIKTKGEDSSAIVAQSIGGGGGNGGMAIAANAGITLPVTASVSLGGKGGTGAGSNNVTVNNDSDLTTEGHRSSGITAQSIGGGGGNGGIAVAASAGSSIVNVNVALGGNGGNGGEAKTATVNNSGNISTKGVASTGILAQSIGGGGGNGGITVSGSLGPSLLSANIALGGAGGKGNVASQALITNKGNIITKGASSSAIVSQSIGGAGGNAGGAVVASVGSANAVNLGIGGNGGEGGKAGLAKVENEAEYIGTAGDNSSAIIAQSIGGDGGNGGFAGAADIFGGNSVGLSFGGAGSKGAEANKAIVNSTGSIGTKGHNSSAIVAQSIGGTGGNGGLALSVKAAGSGQLAANIALGGKGGNGGLSDEVKVIAQKSHMSNPKDITLSTEGSNAAGILAQSIAGSGGNGGFSVAGTALTGGGMSVGVALGGNAGQGAKAEKVQVTTDHNIVTTGDSSAAIVAQSVGGDGGNGGFAVSAGADIKAVTANVTLGGKGGAGGQSGQVVVDSSGSLMTLGENSAGVIAQSLGGGGGNAGFTVAAGVSTFASAAVALGGTGGTGGMSQNVLVNLKNTDIDSPSKISTVGNHSIGALAQSMGGSGGNGGFSVAAGLNANLYGGATASVALGGSGGTGGTSGGATIKSDQMITTKGDFSSALQAQSIGGSGGNGGFAVATALAGSIKFPSVAFSVALGGKGGKGGTAGVASVTSTEFIETFGDFSNGVIAQSLGGSGGTGGFSGALSGSFSPKGAISASVAVGGSGGTGGKAGTVDVTVEDDIVTHGTSSSGIVAQSIGGSGGAGGLAVSGAFTVTATGPAIALGSSVGGTGGLGSQAKLVQVNNAGNISTEGDYAYGILAQSINGNGGSGGIAANLSGAFSQGTAIGASVTIGGKGGGVGYADAQEVKNQNRTVIGKIDTFGILTYDGATRDADGYRINENGQRVNSNALTISAVTSANSSIVTSFGTGIDEYGYRVNANGRHLLDSNGEKILAVGYQMNANGHFYTTGSTAGFVDSEGYQRNAAGNFLAQGSGGNVAVDSSGYLITDKDKTGTRYTLLKNENASLVLTRIDGMYTSSQQNQWNVFLSKINYTDAIRAKNNVIVNNINKDIKPKAITTEGYGADGILVQSIGGNGGVGGMSISGALAGSTNGAAVNASVAVGGSGGKGGIAGDVTVENTNSTLGTKGDSASAIRAQSIGGSGGKGGLSIAAGIAGSTQTAASLTASVGGGGGSGNVAGNVSVTSTNNIEAVDEHGNLLTSISTQGNSSHGIAAESIGGGGGDGGFSGSFAVSGSLNKSAPAVAVSIGGQAGDGNKSGNVTVKSVDNIWTEGVGSSGILAKSIAGGGGDGGFGLSVSASANASQDKKALGASIAVGGFGGSGNVAGKVNVDSEGFIKSKGDYSNGVLAQSIGGGGGNGGMAVSVDAMLAQNGMGLSASVGGWGGTGGTGGNVDVKRLGDIYTEGNRAAGILAQSIGGGGGNGGNSYSGSVYLDGLKGTDKTTNITASVGGFGGNGNTSDIVTVNSIGNIYTSGMLSSAIQAQSIGGGGGNGGNASTTTLKLECGDLCTQDTSGSNSNTGSTEKSDTNISFSVGGWGGTGNDASDVNVISSGVLATLGLGSHGIYAQSIGGGGGDGGSSIVESKKFNLSEAKLGDNKLTFALGVGGYKGAAGKSGDVNVEHSGVIFTKGDNAKGIFAQAIGGGGGNGGDTSGATVGVGGGALQEELAVGMSTLAGVFGQEWDTTDLKGAAGNAGLVNVTTKQTQLAGDIQNIIYTTGKRADAIFAQSVGGGGGIGGTASAKLAIGGDGGAAGNGGVVNVTNALSLVTEGLFSRGIFAQSIGGGGGTGGDVENKATVGIGGSGKNAGNADTVTVNNDAVVLTQGDGAQGILAQSIGGGGGTGGSVEQATIAIGGGTLTSVLEQINAAKLLGTEVFVEATGGHGDTVTINNSVNGHIVTKGNKASAILAQSVGGGGGVGGNASGTISIGGFGSAAGNGKDVVLDNKGTLETYGKNSSALVAQSIGGGGGEGGSSDGGVDTKDNTATVKEALVAIGGNGAHAGNAGRVTIVNAAELIYTEQENSKGILAQSIGGGGGQGGSSNGIDIAGTMGGATDTVKEKLGSLGLGSGATASVISAMTSVTGLVQTAQNVISSPLQSYFNSLKGKIAGGDASSVIVKNTDKDSRIVTKGNGADAIVAQSIGGGGGTSGSASGILVAGAAQGAQGNAGTVYVENNGLLITEGEHAAAIVAQSIGGGGGLSSGLDQTAVYTELGASGASGLGDTVSVNNAGTILTTGRLSQAIVAQSISGGGGSVGLSEQLSLGGSNTSQSHAKDVSVNNSGYIGTETDGSSAIIAQSIGGGGGFAAGTQNLLTSGSGSGNSGNLTISNIAASGTQPTGIVTTGRYAHGIAAQSVAGGGGYSNLMDANGNLTGFFAGATGGTGTAGNVSIDQLGNISTQGEGSYSIFAQSVGAENGNLSIHVGQDSVLVGGKGAGAAIGIFDGRNNLLTNAGYLTGYGQIDGLYLDKNLQLTASGWLDANAVKAGVGDDQMVNNAFMTGSIWLDAGQNSLTNSLNAWLVAGQMIQMNLAGASTLGDAVNQGNWAVGGVNRVDATYLDGNFTQANTGVMYWDYDLDRSSVQPIATPQVHSLLSGSSSSGLGASDIMQVTGTATLGGSVSVNLLNPNLVTPGTFDQTIVNAKNVVDTGFTVDAVPSAVALFNKVVTNNSSAIRANIDFARTALSENGQNLGQAINAIQLDQTSTAFGPVAAALLYRPDIATLQTAYDSISGEGNAAILQTAFTHTQGLMNDISVQSDYWRSRSNYAKNNNVYTVICDKATADGEQCIDDSQWRVWINGQNGTNQIYRDDHTGAAAYSAESYRTVAGLDYALNKNMMLGLAFGSSKTQFNVENRATSGLVESNSLALYGSQDFEKLYVKGALSYDWLDANTTRFAMVEGSAVPIVPVAGVSNNLQADFNGEVMNGRLEVGYKTNWKKINITPFAGVQVSSVKIDETREKATETDDLLALAYSKNDAYSVPVFVGAQFDTMFMFSEGSIQPYAKLSFAHDFSTRRQMEASFVSAPGYKFEVQGAVPDANTMDVHLGFKMTSITNLAFYGQFNGQYSENGAKNEGGTLGLELHW